MRGDTEGKQVIVPARQALLNRREINEEWLVGYLRHPDGFTSGTGYSTGQAAPQ